MVSKGKKDMSKYKVGDKVRVVDNFSGHDFLLGEIVVLEVGCGTDWLASKEKESWYVCEVDIESISDEGIKEASSMDYNNVSKPAHYNHGDGIECIDYIKQVLGKEGFIAYCRGNLIKYNHRAMYKGNPTEDLAKAEQYLKWVNETLKEIHK